MRSTFGAYLTALALASLTAAGVADSSPASDPAASLGVWVGRWNFGGRMYSTKYSQAHADTGVADCEWTANRGYVTCDYFSNDPPHDDLAVLSYNTAAKAFMVDQIHKDRPPTSGIVMHHGNTWITSAEVRDKGTMLVLRTTFVFLTRDKQTTTVQVSADKGRTWTTMIRVTAAKTD
jgi:hypothetical protein